METRQLLFFFFFLDFSDDLFNRALPSPKYALNLLPSQIHLWTTPNSDMVKEGVPSLCPTLPVGRGDSQKQSSQRTKRQNIKQKKANVLVKFDCHLQPWGVDVSSPQLRVLISKDVTAL